MTDKEQIKKEVKEHPLIKNSIKDNIKLGKFVNIVIVKTLDKAEKEKQELIKKINKIVEDARMYADMTEDEFWESSTISPEEAEKRASYFEEFYNKLFGEKNDR